MNRRAFVFLRHQRHYRRKSFEAGLAAIGFEIVDDWVRRPEPGDVLVLWNRRRATDPVARKYVENGGRVIIAENGYLPIDGEKSFALARDNHNGAGRWWPGDEPRYQIDLQPWRSNPDGQIVILAQRGIGIVGIAQPQMWAKRMPRHIKSSRPVMLRHHPGVRDSDRSLDEDLAGAFCAITWASGAGLKALIDGVPVFYGLPNWIGRSAARPVPHDQWGEIEHPYLGDRSKLVRDISWAQWRIEEIESGAAFAHLLDGPGR